MFLSCCAAVCDKNEKSPFKKRCRFLKHTSICRIRRSLSYCVYEKNLHEAGTRSDEKSHADRTV